MQKLRDDRSQDTRTEKKCINLNAQVRFRIIILFLHVSFSFQLVYVSHMKMKCCKKNFINKVSLLFFLLQEIILFR